MVSFVPGRIRDPHRRRNALAAIRLLDCQSGRVALRELASAILSTLSSGKSPRWCSGRGQEQYPKISSCSYERRERFTEGARLLVPLKRHLATVEPCRGGHPQRREAILWARSSVLVKVRGAVVQPPRTCERPLRRLYHCSQLWQRPCPEPVIVRHQQGLRRLQRGTVASFVSALVHRHQLLRQIGQTTAGASPEEPSHSCTRCQSMSTAEHCMPLRSRCTWPTAHSGESSCSGSGMSSGRRRCSTASCPNSLPPSRSRARVLMMRAPPASLLVARSGWSLVESMRGLNEP